MVTKGVYDFDNEDDIQKLFENAAEPELREFLQIKKVQHPEEYEQRYKGSDDAFYEDIKLCCQYAVLRKKLRGDIDVQTALQALGTIISDKGYPFYSMGFQGAAGKQGIIFKRDVTPQAVTKIQAAFENMTTEFPFIKCVEVTPEEIFISMKSFGKASYAFADSAAHKNDTDLSEQEKGVTTDLMSLWNYIAEKLPTLSK